MLLRSASTPILKYPQSLTGLDGAGSLFQNRPISTTASPIKKIERMASDSNLKLLTIPGRKNFCTSPMGSPVAVKEDGMGVFATTREPASGGGGSVGSEGFSTAGDGCGDWGRGRDSMEEYYQMMIEKYPGDCVLLANYAKYLREVQVDLLKAEEYCERALVNGNGDIFSMYAELIWSNHKDAARAKAYFEQATKASPNDCHVHAAFARFLWDAGVEEEEEEEEEEDEEENEFQFPTVTAFPQTQFSHEHPVTAAS